MINAAPIPLFLARVTKIQPPFIWKNRVAHVLQLSPSYDEVVHHLREAINMHYTSHGHHLPKILQTWGNSGVMIDYSTLPRDIQEGIVNIIMQSSF